MGESTAGVVALSTQVPGTELVDRLAGVPLLLIHGENDGVLPDLCSQNVFARAGEPKKLVIVPGESHILEGATERLVEELTGFIQSCSG